MFEHILLSRGAAAPRRQSPPTSLHRRPTPVRPAWRSGQGFPVYFVERERSLRIALTRDLTAAGFATRPYAEVADLVVALPELAPGCVILDIAAIAEGAPLRAEAERSVLSFPTILTFSSIEPGEAVAAVRLRAADLLSRPVAILDLVAALRRAEPRVRELEQRLRARHARAALARLTPREREIMDCMMKGLSNKEMARALGLSPRTVEMHRARLQRRLGVGSLAELFVLAFLAREAGPDESDGGNSGLSSPAPGV